MKAIQKEMGDEEGRDEFAEIEDKIKKTKLSKEAREKASHELKKLRQISPMSPEGTVVRNYLDWLLSIPWNKKSKINNDLVHAQQILDHDHYGVEKVKERIVEYLAVQQRANKLTGPIRAWSVLRASARPRSASRSRRRPAATSCASRSAAYTMRPRSGATGAPISARCPARSSS